MFGFGKKKFNAKTQAEIFANLTLFQSWTIDYKKRDLNTKELIFISEKIAQLLKIDAKMENLQEIALMALLNREYEKIREIRKRHNFDENINEFCKSLKLDPEWYEL